MRFQDKLTKRVHEANSLVCVGLDGADFGFNRSIIEQTQSFVCAYKPNVAFYEAYGVEGWAALTQTVRFLQEHYPEVVTIADAKRADIGSTNEQYVKALFDDLGFDALTLHPYLGAEALKPFLEREDKGCIVLCRTSNPGAGEIQDMLVDGKPLWYRVAERVRQYWNALGNCGLVVGATYPEELSQVRQLVGDMLLLVPGVGAQGGSVKAVVTVGKDSEGGGLLINSSRGVFLAPDPARVVEELRDEINRYRV